MKGLIAWAQGFVVAFGGLGLFAVAFLDASFLSLPEVNDILVVWMVAKHKELFAYYATMATLGSVAGCYALYGLAWKGGEAFVRKRAKSAGLEQGLSAIRRYGFLALLIPSILPPPAPFKIFVLGAGLARVNPVSFGLAIGVGRGLRYFAAALLAVWYGDAALAYIADHGKEVALVTAAILIAIAVAFVWWQRRHPVAEAPST
jgi:membrane protein YqaA with SNARE-associated domain